MIITTDPYNQTEQTIECGEYCIFTNKDNSVLYNGDIIWKFHSDRINCIKLTTYPRLTFRSFGNNWGDVDLRSVFCEFQKGVKFDNTLQYRFSSSAMNAVAIESQFDQTNVNIQQKVDIIFHRTYSSALISAFRRVKGMIFNSNPIEANVYHINKDDVLTNIFNEKGKMNVSESDRLVIDNIDNFTIIGIRSNIPKQLGLSFHRYYDDYVGIKLTYLLDRSNIRLDHVVETKSINNAIVLFGKENTLKIFGYVKYGIYKIYQYIDLAIKNNSISLLISSEIIMLAIFLSPSIILLILRLINRILGRNKNLNDNNNIINKAVIGIVKSWDQISPIIILSSMFNLASTILCYDKIPFFNTGCSEYDFYSCVLWCLPGSITLSKVVLVIIIMMNDIIKQGISTVIKNKYNNLFKFVFIVILNHCVIGKMYFGDVMIINLVLIQQPILARIHRIILKF